MRTITRFALNLKLETWNQIFLLPPSLFTPKGVK